MSVTHRITTLLLTAILAGLPVAAAGEDETATAGTSTNAEDASPTGPQIDFYGYIKLDASWDSSVIDAGNFARWVASTSLIESHDHFNLTARQSRLGVRIDRQRDGQLLVNGRIEIDFYGGGGENKNQPMLRHGYAEIVWPERGLTVLAGQTSDLISPLVPATINYPVAWWAGNIGYRRPQIRVTKSRSTADGGALVIAAALSRSIGDDFGKIEPGDSGADSGVPTVQVALSRQFSRSGQAGAVGISAHWGKEELREQLGETLMEFDSWSLGLDYSVPISARYTFKGEVWTGEDLDDYLGGIGQGINRSTGEPISSTGGWLAVEGRPREKSFVGVGGSLDDPEDDNLPLGSRTRNGALWATYLYDVRSYLRSGIEVSHWSTEYAGLGDESAVRVQGTLSYSF